jgi:hypothetical protein
MTHSDLSIGKQSSSDDLSISKENARVSLVNETAKGGKNMGQYDTRQLIAVLKSKGFTVTLTGNIWIIRRGDEFVAAMSTSPTDLRALKNALSVLGGIDSFGPPEGE